MLEKVCDNITGGAMGKIIKDTNSFQRRIREVESR